MKCNGTTCRREAEPGRKACAECRVMRRQWHHNYMVRNQKPADICRFADCARPRAKWYQYCAECRERQNEARQAAKDLHFAAKAAGLPVKVTPPRKRDLPENKLPVTLRRKAELLSHYGGPICVCCEETRLEFLTLDHIDGGGSDQMRELRRLRTSFPTWIKKNDYPPGFRVLCLNCNFSLGHYGYCPHPKGLTQVRSMCRPKRYAPKPLPNTVTTDVLSSVSSVSLIDQLS
jgi:hypothetical protein